VIFATWIQGFQRVKRLRLSTSISYLALALTAVELVHGLTESSPVLGASLATVALGLGVGLTDRAADLTRSTAPAAAAPSSPAQSRPSARDVLDAIRQDRRHLPTRPSP
jgi:hypothetical protein